MNILDKIIDHKRKEVAERKSLYPAKLLEQSIYFESRGVSMCHYLRRPDLNGIIAEIKRQSPSEGMIHEYVDIEAISIGYMQAGASALSVLTDTTFFGGKNQDLTTARKYNFCPILRKDFTIDEYQIIEAKSIGADVILLIASCLSPEEVSTLARFARSLQLEVLLEVHNLAELQAMPLDEVDIVGVNNRNLDDFSVDITTSLQLAEHIPVEKVKISESGLHSALEVAQLKDAGYDGFLIGSHFMRHPHPEKACADFINALQSQKQTKTA